MSEELDLHVRKRNRPSLVCQVCKKRKVKCDKIQPCSSCVKNKTEHLCMYDSNWSTDKRPNNNYVDSARLPAAIISPSGQSNKVKKHEKSKNSSNINEGVVIIPKSELEELKAKALKYESRIISPAGSDISSGSLQSTTQTSSPCTHDNVLNNTLDPLQKGLFQSHDPQMPGNVSDDLFSSNRGWSLLLRSEPISATNVNLSEFPKNDFFAVGMNPYESLDETINFYDDYNSIDVKESSRRMNYGPLAWGSLSRKDRSLALLRQFTSTQKAQSNEKNALHIKLKPPQAPSCSSIASTLKTIKITGIQNCPSFLTQPDSNFKADENQVHQFEQRALETDGYNDVIPYKNAIRNVSSNERVQLLNENAITLGLTISGGKLDRELKLIEQIKLNLPKKKVIWLLLKRFFRVIYPFFPFLDEVNFRDEISRIIGPESYEDEKPDMVNVEKRLDLAQLGMLLVILRLSYLSLFSNRSFVNEEKLKTNDPSPEAQELKYLLLNRINMNTVEVAQSCLQQFQLLRRISLPVLQCAIFLRAYHMLAPEDGDSSDGGDAQVFNGMLIQMAYSLGLNREPDNCENTFNDEKTNNLGRAIWYFLAINDISQGYIYGNPLITNSMYYDTKFPFHTKANSNLIDTDLHKSIVKCYKLGEGLIRGPMKKILDLILNVTARVKMSELTEYLNQIEVGSAEAFGRLRDYVNLLESNDASYSFKKIMKVRIMLSMNCFYLAVYFHLYFHYEKNRNDKLSFFYFQKILALAIGEMIPYLLPFICKSHELFGEGADIIINPYIVQAIHRVNDINIIALVRTNFHFYRLQKDPQHPSKLATDQVYRNCFENLSKLAVSLEKCARVCLMATSIMSNRYYHAWAVHKSHSFLLKVITSEEFYEQYPDADIGIGNYALGRLENIINITKSSLDILEAIAVEHCDNVNIHALFETKKTSLESSVPKNSSLSNQSMFSDERKVSISSILANDYNLSASPAHDSGLISSEFQDFNFENSAAIDSLWLKMLSMKSKNNDDILKTDSSNNFNNLNSANSGASAVNNNNLLSQSINQNDLNISNSAIPSSTISSFDNFINSPFNFDGAENFSLFDDLPLNQLFNTGN